jgi:hypothetical protein
VAPAEGMCPRRAAKRFLALFLFAAAGLAPQAHALDYGVNIHIGQQTTTANTQITQIMAQRFLKIARMDGWGWADSTQKAMMRDQIAKINAAGGKVQLIVHSSREWTNNCTEDLASVEQDEYNKAYAAVGYYKDLVQDFEVLNEVQLDPYIKAEVPWNAQGDNTAGYYGKACVARITAVIKGITRAIRAQGAGLRVITGVVGRDYGWLYYLRQNGIDWDVTGTHVYLGVNNNILTDTYFGPLTLFPSLARFGKPITINEFNCNEIYNSGYENTAGAPLTEECLVAVKRRIDEIKANTSGTIESVLHYEMWDQTQNAAPDNHWGLVYDLAHPKVNLFLMSAYAGGSITSAEQYELTRRGLLNNAQIAAMSRGRARLAPPVIARGPASAARQRPAPAP